MSAYYKAMFLLSRKYLDLGLQKFENHCITLKAVILGDFLEPA